MIRGYGVRRGVVSENMAGETEGENEMGCVHIYCGEGKGKTSAALGLAVRAAGRGKRVLIERFLKTDDSGEVVSLKRIPEITVQPCQKTFGFLSRLGAAERAEAASYYQERFLQACRMAEREGYDLLILDELNVACAAGLVPEAMVTDFLKNRPEKLEVVLTGRGPGEGLLAQADYVSELSLVKHPFAGGLEAREGIEY